MQKKNFLSNKLQMARALMITAILLIVAFQLYWVSRLYREEKEGLRKETNNIFRDVVYNLQAERFRNDSLFPRTAGGPNIFVRNFINDFRKTVHKPNADSSGKQPVSDTVKAVSLAMAEKNDSAHSGPATVVIRRGNMPRELEEMIRQQIMSGKKVVINDSAMKGMPPAAGMGMSIMVSTTAAKADSMLAGIQNRVVTAQRVRMAPAHGTFITTKKDSVKRDGKESLDGRFSFNLKYSENDIVKMITTGGVLDDSIPVTKIDSAYRKELVKAGIPLSFAIHMGKDDSTHRKDTLSDGSFATRPASVGFMRPYWYQAAFANPASFLARKLSPQVLFSLFLVAFTSVSFIFLYRNLAQQRRLTEMKNDFISNITHELKTPIATVSVAVEALRNFGGMQNPERTKEYLDISAAELQRLGLLVDKVLKLSLFENRDLELKREQFDLNALLQEVLNTMRLQFEKQHAKVDVEIQGSYFNVNADRLHITSVIYNLLDNALKYSPGKPEIRILLKHETDMVLLSVSDKGLGIPAAFRDRIFDKFFRVPTGDHHNIKGYGLGLSYVAHVVNKHGGTIQVESEEGKASTFTVKLPIA